MTPVRLNKRVIWPLVRYGLSCSYCDASVEITVAADRHGFADTAGAQALTNAVETVGWSMPLVGKTGNWLTGRGVSYEVRCPRHVVEDTP